MMNPYAYAVDNARRQKQDIVRESLNTLQWIQVMEQKRKKIEAWAVECKVVFLLFFQNSICAYLWCISAYNVYPPYCA